MAVANANADVLTLKVMRRRRHTTSDSDSGVELEWKPIGTVVVNVKDGTGTIYINHIDEDWRLFKKDK